jgi:hypothetical protein
VAANITISQPGGAGAGVLNKDLLGARTGVALVLASAEAAGNTWTLFDAPAANVATISDASSQNAGFTAAVNGWYGFNLSHGATNKTVYVLVDRDAAGNLVNGGAFSPAKGQGLATSADNRGVAGYFELAFGRLITFITGIVTFARVAAALAAASADIAVNGQKITGLGAPSAGGDATNKTYTDAIVTFARVLAALGAASSDISVNSRKITNLATPTNNTDAATKAYADSVGGGGGGAGDEIADGTGSLKYDGSGNLNGSGVTLDMQYGAILLDANASTLDLSAWSVATLSAPTVNLRIVGSDQPHSITGTTRRMDTESPDGTLGFRHDVANASCAMQATDPLTITSGGKLTLTATGSFVEANEFRVAGGTMQWLFVAGADYLENSGVTNIRASSGLNLLSSASTVLCNGAAGVTIQANSTTRISVDGTGIGFFAAAPVAKPSALTAANAGTINSGDGTTDAVIANMRTRINELETKIQSLGLLS